MENSLYRHALFAGQTREGFLLSTALTLGWFWSRRKITTVLFRKASIQSPDSGDAITVANEDADMIATPEWIEHAHRTSYVYLIRRFSRTGRLEKTTHASAKTFFNQQGDLTEPVPNRIFAVTAHIEKPNTVSLLWFYSPLDQKTKPTGFNIYSNEGTGDINFQEPVISVLYKGRKFYKTQRTVEPGKKVRLAVTAKTQTNEGPCKMVNVFADNPTCPAPQIASIEIV